jgi:DNA-binding IclR family transcriptional regulator
MKNPYDTVDTQYKHIDVGNVVNGSDVQNYILKTDKKPAAVQSIFRAANILTCLSQGIYTITEIANICNLNKTTVHRILKALVDSRLAIHDPILHQYYLGYSISRMVSSPYITHELLLTCAFKPMRRVSDITEDTVFINILIGLQYTNLYEIPSKYELRVAEINKKIGYVPAGAASKVLLSQRNNRSLNIAMLNMDFRFPDGTIVNEDDLRAELSAIRQKGYCVTYGERVKGCICISAPVTGYFLPAAISVIGPEARIKPRLDEFITEVRDAANQITMNLEKSFDIRMSQQKSWERGTDFKISRLGTPTLPISSRKYTHPSS